MLLSIETLQIYNFFLNNEKNIVNFIKVMKTIYDQMIVVCN